MAGRIFLKDIYLKSASKIALNTSEPIFAKEINESYTNINFDEYIETLDKEFSCLADWKTSTNLACWNCTLKFKTRPWFIPLSWTTQVESAETKYKIIHNFSDGVNKIEKKYVKPFGNFCSPNCAVLFLSETKDIADSLKPNYLSLLYLLYYEFTGKRTSFIKPALPKHKMVKFCGSEGISEEEYLSFLEIY